MGYKISPCNSSILSNNCRGRFFRGKYFNLSFEISIENTTLYLLLALQLFSFVQCLTLCLGLGVIHVCAHFPRMKTTKSPSMSFQISDFEWKLK